MSETVYVAMAGSRCLGVYSNEGLANEVAQYNNGYVSRQILIHSREENWRLEYERQVIGER
jgi:hypothetical protein